MSLFLKIAKLFALLVFTVLVILLSASFLLKDKVGFIILKSLNRNLSTKMEVGSYRLSFLKKFPKASLEMKGVIVHSSPGFNRDEFPGINTDTLLVASLVSAEFRITDIIKGVYTIERIGVQSGKVNFYTDSTGLVNYNITIKSNNTNKNETTIDLKRIYLADIDAYYNNLVAHIIIGGKIKNGRLKSRISGGNIDFIAGSELLINRFQLHNFSLNRVINTKLDLNLLSSKNGIKFRKGILHIDNYDFSIVGDYYSDNLLDINLKGNNLNIATIRKYIPEEYLKSTADFDPSGILTISSKIKGQISRKSNPHIEINWQLRNGRVSNKKTNLTFKDLSFDGHYSNGSKNRSETSLVSITGFKATLGSSEYSGSVTLKEFNNPRVDLNLKGRLFPGELKGFFAIKDISTAEGSVDLDFKIENSPWSKKTISLSEFIDLKPEGTLSFNSFSLGLKKDEVLFRDVTGTLIVKNSIVAKNIRFKYKEQNIKIDGEFRNLPEWLSGRAVKMNAIANVSFDKLIPEAFFKDTSDKKGRTQKGISLPGDLGLSINFRIDSLAYKTFSSSNIEGTMIYQPKVMTFKSLKMRSLSGTIAGNGMFIQNDNKGLVASGNFIVTNIDVNKAFTTFHNFGQSFLKAENIKGTLSGSLSLLLPLDSLLKFQIKTLTAEGNYHLVNGALINFDPVKQLSSFIELSELENISFEQLDNDFFIRNNFLFVPQMEVKSSAADLSVNGKHSFENDYEYHVKILLSEILSKKRIKKKGNNTEFGAVQDDGLGRTSLLLKIIGKGDEAKVGYDMKAAGAEVKNNIRKERQTLKTILNQEYGWYKNDSATTGKPAEKKSRFRITWEDSDSAKVVPDPPVIKKKKMPYQ